MTDRGILLDDSTCLLDENYFYRIRKCIHIYQAHQSNYGLFLFEFLISLNLKLVIKEEYQSLSLDPNGKHR